MKPIEDTKYKKAKKRVEEIKGFYMHATVYILVNLFLLFVASGILNGIANVHVPDWGHFVTPFFWGIGLTAHGLYVFQFKSNGFLKKWEERKIEEYMKKDEEELSKFDNSKYQ